MSHNDEPKASGGNLGVVAVMAFFAMFAFVQSKRIFPDRPQILTLDPGRASGFVGYLNARCGQVARNALWDGLGSTYKCKDFMASVEKNGTRTEVAMDSAVRAQRETGIPLTPDMQAHNYFLIEKHRPS